MKPPDYIDVLSANYFERYLSAGGSAFKMVISPPGTSLKGFSQLLHKKVSEAGAIVLKLDAVADHIHRVDKLFFAVAKCIAWDEEAAKFVHRYIVPSSANKDVHSTMHVSGKQKPEIAEAIKKNVSHDYGFCAEFRTALTHLCLSRLAVDTQVLSPYSAQVKGWLMGEPVPMAALKPAMIFRKVQRNSARNMLYSAFRFLRRCGYPFVVLEIDVSRYAEQARVAERTLGHYYSNAACFDLYELLRQFIDDMERFDGTMVVVTGPNTIVTDARRGISRYQALQMRLWSDVRIQNAENPMAPLVWLS